MKRFKSLVWGIALFSILGFTSCLNDDVDNTMSGAAFLRVRSSMLSSVYFEDPYETKYIPNQNVEKPMGYTTEMAIVPLSYNYDTDVDQAKNQVKINLLSNPVFLRTVGFENSAPAEDLKSVSLASVDPGYTTIWGKNEFIILALKYYLKKGTTSENYESEVRNHSFVLYYDPAEKIEDGVLKLYLRYNISGDSAADWNGDDYSVSKEEYRTFNLGNILEGKSGIKKVKIEYKRSAVNNPTNDSDKMLSTELTLDLYSEAAM